jgi:probable HAF family extracellular repeat protein
MWAADKGKEFRVNSLSGALVMTRKTLFAALCVAATVASAANTRWTITDIGQPWDGQAQGLNNRGEVTGWMRVPTNSPFHHAYIFSNGETRDLGVPPGQFFSNGYGISNNGYVVGDNGSQPFVWRNGEWTVVPYPGTFTDVSESGTAVGGVRFPGTLDSHATSFKDGVLTDLGTMGGGGWSFAWAINNSGTIVGNASLPTPPFSGLFKFRGFVYENGVMRDIGTLGGTSSYLYDVNNSGTAVGASDLANGRMVATVYEGGVLHPLAEIPGNSAARSVNARGDVVGSSDAGGGWLYSDGKLTMLAQIPEVAAAGYTSISPNAINDRGWITGTGYKPATGGQSFVLIPK